MIDFFANRTIVKSREELGYPTTAFCLFPLFKMLTGNDLIKLGFKESKALGLALEIMQTEYAHLEVDQKLGLLQKILSNPVAFINDPKLNPIANELLRVTPGPRAIAASAMPYSIYGGEVIEQGALQQMDIAMRLPVTVAGALMPDAHQGYGLPIGGVLATKNAVIPYGVGVDIGCRMCMTLYDLPVTLLDEKRAELKKMLLDNTRFGFAPFKNPRDHEVLESDTFKGIRVVRELKDTAWRQLGSSGGGNHFVEFGVVEVIDTVNEYKVAPGNYLALLSHSGSRGLGANIARHYTKIAMETCQLPQEAKHLAWLELDTEAGQEYWMAMNLAGEYASACHHQIHERMAIGLRETPVAMIENHHNFAWKEKDNSGNDIIVHRKGATPAGKGVLGIIPGSMATPGFIVRGKGDAQSINSASHGAGRTMSRTKAKQTIPLKEVNAFLTQAGVEVIGSGLDEAPMAYKDIYQVMEYQKDLVHVHGRFMPKIVRMCGDEKFQEAD
jgi:tRNA-splicing ligase RtcB (3'-phosphate/5'-hydroxy nucleic acid ligase)